MEHDAWSIVWKCVGICGVNVWDYPLKALIAISNAKFEFEWGQTSELLAMIHNRTIWGKGKPKSADEFMPGKKGKNKSRVKLTPDNIAGALD